MPEKILLALDLALTSGYCFARVKGDDKGEIYRWGTFRVDDSSSFLGDHCLDLQSRVRDLIEEEKVTHLVVEDYFFNPRKRNGSQVNVALRTAVYILARTLGLEYTIISISGWKTYIAGSSKPNKEQKKKWKTRAQKFYIQEALWKRYKIRFPNHGISEKTGKPTAPVSDVVDVVGQMIYYLGMIEHIPDKSLDVIVEIPEDVLWKKKPVGVYDYQ